jgi:hypothetical protein
MTTAEPKVVAETMTEVMKEKGMPPLRQKAGTKTGIERQRIWQMESTSRQKIWRLP